MNAACIGPILWWITQHAFPSSRGTPTVQGTFCCDDHGVAGAADPHDGALTRELIEAGACATNPRHGALSHALMEAGGAVTASELPVETGEPSGVIAMCADELAPITIAAACADELAPIAAGPAALGCKSGERQLDKSRISGVETHTRGRDSIPAYIVFFVEALGNTIDVARPEGAASLRASAGGPVGSERVRDLYPMPAIPLHGFALEGSGGKHWDDHATLVITRLANASLLALSLLAGFNLGAPVVATVAAQRAVQVRALGKAERMCRRLCGVAIDKTPRHCFATLVDDAVFLERPPNPALRAEGCDLLKHSACVDPLPFISPEHAAIVSDPDKLFVGLTPDTVVTGRPNRGDREEYAKLVVRQLRSGKVGIGDSVFASETIFAVGKSNGNLREVWSGHTISTYARTPPKPPNIASPSALLALESSNDKPLRLYKRDAACFFDQLALPAPLQKWFGRPRLKAGDIMRFTDMGVEELATYWSGSSTIVADHDIHPFCLSWPMGFAWSSFLAQSTLLHQCFLGGLRRNQVLADDHIAPFGSGLSFALATDDLMVFARGNQAAARHRLARVDRAVADAGIIAHPGKNVDEAASGTAIGVDIDDGKALAPHDNELCVVILGILHMLTAGPRLNKKDMQAVIGHLTWFALLNRHIYACFDVVYDVIAKLDEDRLALDAKGLFEIALCSALFPWLEADLT